MTLRSIDRKPFEKSLAKGLNDPGAAPILDWIAIADLRIDPDYQRDVLSTGRKNIVRIANEFDWTKFSTVVVAPIEGGKFVVVDGQHRATAASLRGIKKVPCQIIVADKRKQAAAFAAINAVTTEMSPMQVHAAKIVAADVDALRLTKLCKEAEAGVTILRYPVQTKLQKLGETMAVGMLYRMLAKFGEEVLVVALSCITRTRDGYPGLIRSQLVTALCVVLEAEPEWQDSRHLLKAIGKLDLRATFTTAAKECAAGSSGGLVASLAEAIADHLENAIPKSKAAA